MEKKSGVNGLYIVVFILVVAVIVLAIMLLSSGNNTASKDCLRGNNFACVYFQAQERADEAKKELQAANEILSTAKAEYQNSISTEEPTNQ